MTKSEEAEENSPPSGMRSRKNILWLLAFVAVMIGLVSILSISIISYLYIRTTLPVPSQDVPSPNRTMDVWESESLDESSSLPVSNQTDSPDSGSSEIIPGERDSVCQTEECQRTAKSFLGSMNTSVDPCEDFYEFACGNWASNSDYDGQGDAVMERIDKRLIELMELITEEDREELRQLKVLYQTCVDLGDIRAEFRNSTGDMLSMSDQYGKLFRLFALTDPGTGERRAKCIELLELPLIPFALTHKYIAEYLKNGTIDAAWELQTHITSAFHNLVSRLDWMDRVTKREVLGKAHSMEVHLGYPDDWHRNPEASGWCYKDLTFTNGTFADNFLAVMNWDQDWRSGTTFEYEYNKCLQKSIWNDSEIFTPSSLNGYYLNKTNAVVIGVGYLEQPYFGLGLRAADYGVLGITLGHELMHGFDLRYQMPWNSSFDSREIFDSAARCIKSQYTDYAHADREKNYYGDSVKLDMESTLREDFADVGGVQVAYQAYQLYLEQRVEPEPMLPGLEEYTEEQVFFLAYANKYCAIEYHAITPTGQHSPAKYRVNGPLSNSLDFSNAWQCPQSSRMNPHKKCSFWE